MTPQLSPTLLIDSTRPVAGCYLIHFSAQLPGSHAQHYLGWSPDILARLTTHAKGRGAKITAAAVLKYGVTLTLARVWVNADRTTERSLKGKKHYVMPLCPICNGARAYNRRIRNRVAEREANFSQPTLEV